MGEIITKRTRGQKIKPSEFDKQIGLKIKIIRIAQGKTQDDLAKYLNLSLQQVQQYEKGTNKIAFSILINIAEYCNIPFEFFIDGGKF
ncbi:MAG: transcriptional regulator with XRE-family HTH domain [Candidatus Deianiraeaceae bacterium]|jgi:transcriptional regulator with XRE-family HTH domain